MAVRTKKHVLRIMDGHGHTDVIWNARSSTSVAEVKAKFDELIARNYFAYARTGTKEREQIREFEPKADEIIMALPMQGG